MSFSAADLDVVFGANSSGDDPEQRAMSSLQMFVRSQLQLAFDSEGATGLKLTASEALENYGWNVLLNVGREGSHTLLARYDEPAATLKSQREGLGLEYHQVARQANVSIAAVEKAETIGARSKIRDLEAIAQTLALNGSLVGYVAGANGDPNLGVRLRELSRESDAQRFSPTDVLALAEAAWVISTQHRLAAYNLEHPRLIETFRASADYRFKAYDRGYELAAQTRIKLGLSPEEPIESLKILAEERLGIPVVQQRMAERFAGATISNSGARGIVINEKGPNENVWVRRMTVAHELGHLLWDPDERLNKLKVDQYSDIEQDRSRSSDHYDVVEIRANAFAISFLAPPQGVRAIMASASDVATGLAQVMEIYGISATAAKWHVKNTTNISSDASIRNLPFASDEWVARENLTIDYFRPETTPISRRGRFAWFVGNALIQRKISLDTAASYLKSPPDAVEANLSFIMDALHP